MADKKHLAKNVYLYFRVYQHYLMNHNLDDDSNSIDVDSLMDFVENQIDEEEREELKKFCEEAY